MLLHQRLLIDSYKNATGRDLLEDCGFVAPVLPEAAAQKAEEEKAANQINNFMSQEEKDEIIRKEEAKKAAVGYAFNLFNVRSVVVSHGVQDDPILNYANARALQLWETDWKSLTQMPSRKTAEPMEREERQHLLDQVHGKDNIEM